jgi:hypothetical protein
MVRYANLVNVTNLDRKEKCSVDVVGLVELDQLR